MDGKLVKSLGLPPSLKSFVSKAEAAATAAGQEPLAAVGEAAGGGGGGAGGGTSSRSLLARRRRARVSKGPVGNVRFYAPDYNGSDSRRACISKGKGGSNTVGASGAGDAAKGRGGGGVEGSEPQDSRRRDLRLGGGAAVGAGGAAAAAAATAAGGGRDVVAEMVRGFVRGVSAELLPSEVDVSLHRAHPNVTGRAARSQQADMDLLLPNMKVVSGVHVRRRVKVCEGTGNTSEKNTWSTRYTRNTKVVSMAPGRDMRVSSVVWWGAVVSGMVQHMQCRRCHWHACSIDVVSSCACIRILNMNVVREVLTATRGCRLGTE